MYLKIGLVLLNRNESVAIPQILPLIPKNLFECIFAVDGNSTDGSDLLLSQGGYEVLPQRAVGRGVAFQMGFSHIRDSNIDALVFLSCDGNEDPNDLHKFVEHLNLGADIVIASRMMKGARNEEDKNLFRPRKWGNLLFMSLGYLFFGVGKPRITDPINGYRGITISAWNKLNLDAKTFDIEFQMSMRAYKHGLNVVEFPTIEGQRIGGESGAKALQTTYRMLSVLTRELYSKFR